MNKRSAEETKQQILVAARKTFAGQGYAQASMRSIAREAGISVGGVYLHFKNKEELYQTLQDEWMDQLNRNTIAALRSSHEPAGAIASFISTSIEFARRYGEMINLMGRELGFSYGSELKRGFFRDRRKLIAELIDQGVACGVFRPCDSEEAARIIFNILRGFVLSMVIDEEALFSPEGCVDLVLNGLIRREDRR
jgi:AcrR family transcriptional regulator